MDLTEKMEGNLENIRAGAVGFRVVGIVAMLLGFLLVGVAVLRSLGQLDAGAMAVLQALLGNLGGVVNYFLVAWLAARASDAFDAVAALIVELREIV